MGRPSHISPGKLKLLALPQVYLTGHGGEGFLKFQDREELTAQALAATFGRMHAGGRYKEVLLVVDTCQAASLFDRITAPGVLGIGSSRTGAVVYLGQTSAMWACSLVQQTVL